MGKKSGHKGHEHRHHRRGHGMGGHPDFGMGPMHRMGGPMGPQWDPRTPFSGARGAFPDSRGPPCDARGPPVNRGGPSEAFCGPFDDHRFDPSFMRHRMHHMFGGRRGPRFESSSSSSSSSSSDSSSSDSDTKCKKKCEKRRRHHFKHWHRMRHMMSDPNWNKVQCTLCWRQIRPLAETEVLECGHLYHRQCLKELFTVSQTGEESQIFCTQCRQQIDTDLVTEFQNRFNSVPTTAPQTTNEDMARDMKNLKVK